MYCRPEGVLTTLEPGAILNAGVGFGAGPAAAAAVAYANAIKRKMPERVNMGLLARRRAPYARPARGSRRCPSLVVRSQAVGCFVGSAVQGAARSRGLDGSAR